MARLFVSLAFAGSLALSCAHAQETTVPSKMRAAVYTSRPWNFKFDVQKVDVIDMDVPKPGHGEVLVQVHASNINPVDHKIVEMLGIVWSYPHKLGFDLAGVVVAVGPGCTRLSVGDEVWGEATTLSEAIHSGGAYAQYAAISENVLGLRPQQLSMQEAGALPMVALTSYESLTWAAGASNFLTKENVTVLVLGGSGGTGHIGIQMAKKAMNATKVITTCSGANADFVQGLGADEVIDYHKHNYWEVLPPKSVDVIYDCVGLKGTGDHAYGLLKQHGRFVTLLQSAMPSLKTRILRPDVSSYAPTCIGKCSRYDRIDAVAALVQRGQLKVHLDVTYGLEDIRLAFNHSLAGHTVGKVAVQIQPPHIAPVVV